MSAGSPPSHGAWTAGRLDARDDPGDVVVAARRIGLVDQAPARRRRIGLRQKHLGDARVGEHAAHPILRGVRDIWGPTDVYGVDKLPPNTQVLVRGQVLAGMEPADPPVQGPKNDPMQPLVWVHYYQLEGGKPGKVIGSTIGAAVDLECADLRRLFVNAIYWGCGLEVPAESKADPVGEYKPSNFGFNGFKKGVKPADLQK